MAKEAGGRALTRAEKGLSIAALIKSTPPYIKSKARDEVTVKKLGKTKTKGGHTAFKAICKSHEKGSRPHQCSVIGLEKEKPLLSKQKRVLVSCDCEFFMYYSEYALSTWGAARIKYSNGEPAVVKNPGNLPLVCKHLVKVLRAIKEHNF